MFNSLHCSINQELFEKHLCNQNIHYERFPLQREAITCYCQIDIWDTKEDTGKSMKNALYVLQYAKSTSWVEATLNNEKIKPVALAVIELCLSEGISQSGSQSVEYSVMFLKFQSNLLKAFEVNLKVCLGLILSNQYCLIVIREN